MKYDVVKNSTMDDNIFEVERAEYNLQLCSTKKSPFILK